MKKLLSAALAVMLLAATAIPSFAYKCDEFEVTVPEGFEEKEMKLADGKSVVFSNEDVDYRICEVFFREDTNPNNYTAEEAFKEGSEKTKSEYIKSLEEKVQDLYDITVEKLELRTIGGYEGLYFAVKLSVTEDYKEEYKDRYITHLLIPREKIVVTVDSYGDSEEEALDLLKQVVKNLDITVPEATGKKKSEYMSIIVSTLTFAAVGGIIGAIASRSKKKEAAKASANAADAAGLSAVSSKRSVSAAGLSAVSSVSGTAIPSKSAISSAAAESAGSV